jgi:hypothetical protein
VYIEAYISPGGGIGLTYGSRILFAVGELDAGPRGLTKLNAAKSPVHLQQPDHLLDRIHDLGDAFGLPRGGGG